MMDDAVWIDTTDGGLLHQLLGHYPTLHDTRLTSIAIDRETNRVIAQVEYADETEAGDKPLRVRMKLEWLGVRSMDLQIAGDTIISVSFDRSGPLLTTRLERCAGTHGVIVSDGFEATLTEAQALPSDSEGVRVSLSANGAGNV